MRKGQSVNQRSGRDRWTPRLRFKQTITDTFPSGEGRAEQFSGRRHGTAGSAWTPHVKRVSQIGPESRRKLVAAIMRGRKRRSRVPSAAACLSPAFDALRARRSERRTGRIQFQSVR